MSVATAYSGTAFQVRSLFRSLLRQSSQFSNYNFREYARRKTRDSFREHQNVAEERRVQELIQSGLQDLRLLKRQTTISQFYQLDKLVVEGQKTGKEIGTHGDIVRQKETGLFRSSRSGRQFDSNRSRTGQVDHDIFEGLPVRRWSRQAHTHSQTTKIEDSEFAVHGPGGTARLPELAMPRDSQLLNASSRALLRAARAGCIYIHQSTHTPEDAEKEGGDLDDGTSGAHSTDHSFTSRKWMALPKHLEPAEVEFLAKRRPGLPSLYGGATAADGLGSGPGPMRRTKFKKTDPLTGKISIYEAWVPEGHRIEGEVTGDIQAIAEQTDGPVNSEMPAPGTVVEGVGVVNSEGVVVAEAGSASVMTPPKRRPPPPKRKGKGIGKGRKKKVMFAPGEGADAAIVHGSPRDPIGTVEGHPKEDKDVSQTPIDQAGQDEDEDDGDDGDDSDEGDESMIDAKTPETPQASHLTAPRDHLTVEISTDTKDVEMDDAASEMQSQVVEPSVNIQEAPPVSSGIPAAPIFETSQNKANAATSSALLSYGNEVTGGESGIIDGGKTSVSTDELPMNSGPLGSPYEAGEPRIFSESARDLLSRQQSPDPRPFAPTDTDTAMETIQLESTQAMDKAPTFEPQAESGIAVEEVGNTDLMSVDKTAAVTDENQMDFSSTPKPVSESTTANQTVQSRNADRFAEDHNPLSIGPQYSEPTTTFTALEKKTEALMIPEAGSQMIESKQEVNEGEASAGSEKYERVERAEELTTADSLAEPTSMLPTEPEHRPGLNEGMESSELSTPSTPTARLVSEGTAPVATISSSVAGALRQEPAIPKTIELWDQKSSAAAEMVPAEGRAPTEEQESTNLA
ncbi:LYR family protein [Penicillium malachiteum]|uniref:LYR family protein n=1 Tax=Penicillium malachiteum TaxID=1324776 RepID=UPI002547D228|nr:LYR family protein [Penicillium malachiteum]KAJ5726372.1 LYR family protein [Penicillium malachiteum]